MYFYLNSKPQPEGVVVVVILGTPQVQKRCAHCGLCHERSTHRRQNDDITIASIGVASVAPFACFRLRQAFAAAWWKRCDRGVSRFFITRRNERGTSMRVYALIRASTSAMTAADIWSSRSAYCCILSCARRRRFRLELARFISSS
jgi:hypothetical protein